MGCHVMLSLSCVALPLRVAVLWWCRAFQDLLKRLIISHQWKAFF